VLYALEQYERYENVEILTAVLRNEMPHLDEHARLLPGFGQEIWTPKFRRWCEGFLREQERLTVASVRSAAGV
jgi:NifB/MoaA-like Fe-S oxidoreductase